MLNLSGKVAFVTGGASGIGLAIAKLLLAEGMKVVVADANEARLHDLQKDFVNDQNIHLLKLDVSDRSQYRSSVAAVIERWEKIHILCNNAGVAAGGTAIDPAFEQWDRAMAINIGGVVNGIKIVSPLLIQQGEGGHIVNTSSMAGVLPLAGMDAYVTAKFAVRGLSDQVRMALSPFGIGVSCLFPGLTRTRALDSVIDAAPDEAARLATKSRVDDMMRDAMDPMEVGSLVVRGIKNNQQYIFTHPEFLDSMRRMNAAIESAIPNGGRAPELRATYERDRFEQLWQLLSMPAQQ